MTDNEKALEIWHRAATYYDFLSQNIPKDTEMHERHFEEHCAFMYNEDGSYKYTLEWENKNAT